MKLIGVKFQGLTCFEEPAGFSTDAPGLIALVGRNGAGKTTALEAVFGALYRQMPSYPGPLYDQVRGDTASIVATFMDDLGDVIRAEVRLNAKRRTSECFLTRRGEPVSTGKGRDYDEQVRRLFGSPELVLASVFASQSKTGAFLSMPRAQRKALFAELLALGRLVVLHEAAGNRQRAVESSMSASLAKLSTLGEGDSLEEAEKALAAAAAAAESAEARARELRGAAEAWEAWRIENAAATAAHRQAVADLERAIAATMLLRSRAKALDERRERMVADWEARPMAQPLDELGDRSELVQRVDLARAALLTAEEQAADLLASERALDSALRERSRVEAELDTAARLLATERAALVRQSEPLDRAPCAAFELWGPLGDGEPLPLSGTCPLLSGAREAAQQVVEIDERLAEIPLARERRLAECASEEAVAALSARVDEIRALNLPKVTAMLRRTLESAEAEVRIHDAAVADAKSYAAEHERHLRLLAEHDESIADVRAEIEQSLDAESMAHDRMTEARAALDALGAGPTFGAEELRSAEDALRLAVAARAAAEARFEAARTRETRAIVVRRELAGLQRCNADVALLREALGPNGAQALMIDAAGPEVTAIVNDLLSETPFTIRLDTVRTKADGGQAEDFAVHVFDGGAERSAEQFSGGQKVFLGEAIGLGLAVFNARRSGVHWRTLFRDETAGALDPENAQHYVRMLRRALVAGGFANCLFVSHVPEVWEQADTVLHVGGGRIE